MTGVLVELFVEELPPKALKRLGEAFAEGIASGLRERGFLKPDSVTTAFASPRRLGAHITGVQPVAASREIPAQTLMPAAIGLDAGGRPTPPLLKKLRSRFDESVDLDQVLRERVIIEDEGSRKVLKLRAELASGESLQVGLEAALGATLAALPIPKVMRYQLADGWTSVDFVRPAHGIVALHGDAVVPVRALGLEAGRTTRGHRFEAAFDPVVLRAADGYAAQLAEQGGVIAGFEARRAEIAAQLRRAAAGEGLHPVEDDALLDEVTALVERPNVLVCRFEPEFLEVPPEVLILTMKANQKYFPLLDGAGKLTNRFLVVSNIRPPDARRVVEGNERVVRPRLADAKFFFDQDRKRTLESRVEGLEKVVYHAKLGTQGERSGRVRRLAEEIGARLGGAALAQAAGRAAALAKADLVTDMVGEFPELQGTMGRYYAGHDGEPEDVALAIEDHYKPRFAGDALPRSSVGLAVALADKLETLVGLFGIGQAPSGDKDPFALRRHALGVVRMLMERSLELSLDELLEHAATTFDAVAPVAPGGSRFHAALPALRAFIEERLAGLLREHGYSVQEIEAVLALKPERLADVTARLAAVRAFSGLPEAASLAAANKRVGNILRKADGAVSASVESALLQEPAEKALHAALGGVGPVAEAAFGRGAYAESLQAWAALKAPVDAFFDAVMVNAEDPALRANRLGLLARLHAAMNRVADLSKLAR